MSDVRFVQVNHLHPDNSLHLREFKLLRFDDFPSEAVANLREEDARLTREAIGEATPAEVRAYHHVLGSMIHDIGNLHGIFGTPTRIVSAEIWADGHGISTILEYPGEIRCLASWVDLPDLWDFKETLEVYGSANACCFLSQPVFRWASRPRLSSREATKTARHGENRSRCRTSCHSCGRSSIFTIASSTERRRRHRAAKPSPISVSSATSSSRRDTEQANSTPGLGVRAPANRSGITHSIEFRGTGRWQNGMGTSSVRLSDRRQELRDNTRDPGALSAHGGRAGSQSPQSRPRPRDVSHPRRAVRVRDRRRAGRPRTGPGVLCPARPVAPGAGGRRRANDDVPVRDSTHRTNPHDVDEGSTRRWPEGTAALR